MANYLVTGGAGFIGSNIVEELVRLKLNKRGLTPKGSDPFCYDIGLIRVLDNFITGKRENLQPFKKKIELIEGDVRDRKVLDKALKGIDYVLHQAALRSVAKSVEDPFETHDVNATGTLNLLIAAKKAGVKKIVNASTCAVYGDAKTFPQKEEDPARPISPYGASKLAAEQYCSLFSGAFGLETVSLRYFNVYGPRQNPESRYSSVVPAFIFDIVKNKTSTIEWDGKQSRDFVFVKDVVRANLLATKIKNISENVFNIGNGYPTTISQILGEIENILDKKITPKFGPKRDGDVRKVYSDISKAKRILGFKPKVTLKEGIKLTIDWFRNVKPTR